MSDHERDRLRGESEMKRFAGLEPIEVVGILAQRLAERNRRIQELTGHAATSSKPKRQRRNARRQAERESVDS